MYRGLGRGGPGRDRNGREPSRAPYAAAAQKALSGAEQARTIMDCEKFETILLNELYDELDELTGAAAKRHLAGCSRCSALFSGMRATRRFSALPLLEPSADLEDRILASVFRAQSEAPQGHRFSRAISWAAHWAMKPQAAMAAVFLLMIGSSVLLLRGHHAKSPYATVTVTEQGAPLASAAPDLADRDRTEDLANAAAAAHGTREIRRSASAGAVAQGSAAAPAAPGDFAEAPAADEAPARLAAAPERARSPREAAKKEHSDETASAGRFASPPPPAAPPAGASGAGSGAGDFGSGALADRPTTQPAARPGGAAPALPAAAATTSPRADTEASESKSGGDGFAAAMAAYRARDYSEAIRLFDALATSGDPAAALWAARSVREGSGCGAATARFDQLAGRNFGTNAGYDAAFEAGRCYRQLGLVDTARARFTRLLTVPSHAVRAQAELDAINPKKTPARAAPAAEPK
jgi:hypothetical protein